jgi:acyl carrier protein
MQNQSEIIQTLIQYILNDLSINDEIIEISEEDNLLGDELIDSMGIMRLVSFVEKEYSVTIPPEDVRIENFINVKAIAYYIKKLKDD